MMIKNRLIFALSWLCACLVHGQNFADSSARGSSIILTDNIQDLIEIKVWRSRYTSIYADSIWMGRNWGADLGRAMAKDGRMAVFQYGPPGTACMLRSGGLSPDHTELNFEGVSLNAVTLGMADFSLLPTFFFDGFSHYQNPSFDSQGQSGIGSGVALIASQHPRPNKLLYWSEYSSLNNFSQGLQAQYNFSQMLPRSGKEIKHYLEAKWSSQSFDNRFTYPLPGYGMVHDVVQENNDVKQGAQWLKWQVSGNNRQLQLLYWRVNRDAELPALIGQEGAGRRQTQMDEQHRFLAQWKQTNVQWMGGAVSWSLGTFALSDKQNYQQFYNGQLSTQSDIFSKQGIVFAKWDWRNNKLASQIRIQNRAVNVLYNANNGITQNIPSARLLHQVTAYRSNWIWTAKAVNQWEYWSGQGYSQRHNVDFRAHYSQHRYEMEFSTSPFYLERMPDFNERYWPGSGNMNLLQEKGKGVRYKLNQSWRQNVSEGNSLEVFLDHDFTTRVVDNWIQWVPQANGIWTPENWKYVKANEFNTYLKLNYKTHNWEWRSAGSIQYLHNQSWKLGAIEGLGESLPYSPKWRLSAEQSVYRKNGQYVQCNWRYVGIRSMNETSDASAMLAAVNLFDLSLGGPVMGMPLGCEWQFGCDNFMNVQYQEVKGYALPGRVWNVKLKIEINKKTTEK